MQLEYSVKGESNKETILFVHCAGANAWCGHISNLDEPDEFNQILTELLAG